MKMAETNIEVEKSISNSSNLSGPSSSLDSLLSTLYIQMGDLLHENNVDSNLKMEDDILRRFNAFTEVFKTNESMVKDIDVLKTENASLHELNSKLQESLHNYEDMEADLDESEEQNEKLMNALKAAKDNFENGLSQQKIYEQTIIELRNAKNDVEKELSELHTKMDTEIQNKVHSVEKEKERIERQLKDKIEEVVVIKRTWDQASKQFEEEQKVLRQWKTNLESQLENSEKTLQDINKRNATEISRLNYALLDSQKNVQESKYQVIEKEAEIRSLQMNYEEMKQFLEDKVKDLELQVNSLSTKLKIENESNNQLNQKVGSFDNKLQIRLKEALVEMENKDREIIRQNQKSHDEEVSRIRKHVTALSTELDQERTTSRKLRDTINQLNDTINKQDQMMDALRGEVATKDSELLAGRQQVTKLSRILAKKMAPPNS